MWWSPPSTTTNRFIGSAFHNGFAGSPTGAGLKLREARMSASAQMGAGDTGVRMCAASAAMSAALSWSAKPGICVAVRPCVMTFSASAGRRRDRLSGSSAGPMSPVRCSP